MSGIVLDSAAEPELESQAIWRPRGAAAWLAAHPTIAYFLRRLATYLVTLWGAITAVFFFYRLIPGNPIKQWIYNLELNHVVNVTASRAVVDHYNEVFGLNGNLFSQYLHFVYQLVFFRNFGPSLIAYPETAQAVIAQALPWTLGLLVIAVVLAWILAIVLGAVVGITRGSPFSEAMTYLAVVVSHLPAYLVAVVLLFVASYRFHVLPSTYAYDTGLAVGLSPGFILSLLYHGILPALSLVLVMALGEMLGMRQQVITITGDDYLTLATAKGLHPWHILRRYILPNCYLPQVTGLVISFGFLFAGNLLIENLFNYPGVGHLFVLAEQNHDLNTMMAITDLQVFMVLTAVFLIDMILPVLDPRITYRR